MARKNIFERIVLHFGGVPAMARHLDNCTYRAIHQWRGVIPGLRPYEIEVKTNGKFTAAEILRAQRKKK